MAKKRLRKGFTVGELLGLLLIVLILIGIGIALYYGTFISEEPVGFYIKWFKVAISTIMFWPFLFSLAYIATPPDSTWKERGIGLLGATFFTVIFLWMWDFI